ncbi:hypothetical protein M3202_18585 [Alkalihalobacillus oceani]|uniref:Uncharacterized protein n=1 Tax=Halalkalibacter oceani TaxID=1653776 RepID=A0A9X2IS01_9BACI|nr:hypothetical protein [Halalkalibacter oceani]MCM3716063.1 hypothetical protein [Halalkalibacter oceani]
MNERKIIPNEDDIYVKIESDLQYDNLYNLIIERDQLKTELFDSGFLSHLEKDMHRWYSVQEAGRILGGDKPIPPSSLSYYIDSLEEYIIPDDAPSNSYIRLNYLSLVKLKMVWLLKDEFRLKGLKAELGITGNPKNVIKETKESSSNRDRELADAFEKIERLETVSQTLLGLLLEKGENDQLQLKQPLQQLLNQNNLIEEQSSVLKKLEDQNNVLKEIQEKQQQQEKESNKRIIESEKKVNSLAEIFRLRKQAEEEWDKLSLLTKITKNRTDFIESWINKHSNKDNKE